MPLSPRFEALSPQAGTPSSRGQQTSTADIESGDSFQLMEPGELILPDELTPAQQTPLTMSFWFPRRFRTNRNRRTQGAIQHGDVQNIFARRRIGLVVNYAAVGFLDGLLPVLVVMMFGRDSAGRNTLTSILHSMSLLRVLAAFCSDAIPMFSRRRRPYLLVAWGMEFVLFLIMASYVIKNDNVATSADWQATVALLSVGHTLAIATSDGLMVEYAHREGEFDRGCIQMLLLAVRYVGELVGRATLTVQDPAMPVSDCAMGYRPGCTTPLGVVFGIGTLVSLSALLSSTWASYVPSRSLDVATAATTFSAQMKKLWGFQRACGTWQLMLFGFFQVTSASWMLPTSRQFAVDILGFSDGTRWISDLANRAVCMVCALAMCTLWRNTNWRKLTLFSLLVGSFLVSIPSTIVLTQQVTTSPALFFLAHHVSAGCEALIMMVRLLASVELAVPGFEATCFTLFTTVFDLGGVVGSGFGYTMHHLMQDKNNLVLWTSAWLVVLCVALYVLQIAVNAVTLPFLPRQKRHAQDRLAYGSRCRSTLPAKLVAVLMAVLFVLVLAYEIWAAVEGKQVIQRTGTLIYL